MEDAVPEGHDQIGASFLEEPTGAASDNGDAIPADEASESEDDGIFIADPNEPLPVPSAGNPEHLPPGARRQLNILRFGTQVWLETCPRHGKPVGMRDDECRCGPTAKSVWASWSPMGENVFSNQAARFKGLWFECKVSVLDLKF